MRFNLLILLWIVILTTESCTRFYYPSNSQNVPLLKSKGEGLAGVNINMGNLKNGAEFNSAYAVTNHFAFITNLTYASASEDDGILGGWTFWGPPPENFTVSYFSYGAGVGFFAKLKNENFLLDVYSGGGLGKLSFESDQSSSVASAKVVKYFIQPSISCNYMIRNKVGISLAFSSQVSQVNYNQINNDFPDALNDNKSLSLFEPALAFTLGPLHKVPLKARFQYTRTIPINNFEPPIEKGNFSVAIFFWFKPKESRKR